MIEVVMGYTAVDISEEINKYIKLGYHCDGALVVTEIRHHRHYVQYTQRMIKGK